MKYEAGTKVTLLSDGGYCWAGKTYKDVYGIVQKSGSLILYYKKSNQRTSLFDDDQSKTWRFYETDTRKAKNQKNIPESVE
jgi:hypothetical protein